MMDEVDVLNEVRLAVLLINVDTFDCDLELTPLQIYNALHISKLEHWFKLQGAQLEWKILQLTTSEWGGSPDGRVDSLLQWLVKNTLSPIQMAIK